MIKINNHQNPVMFLDVKGDNYFMCVGKGGVIDDNFRGAKVYEGEFRGDLCWDIHDTAIVGEMVEKIIYITTS